MDPMEVFRVQIPGEPYGEKRYREVISDILHDLGLIRAIGRLYVYLDIEAPVFAVYGLIRTGIPPLVASDVGDIVNVEGGYQIKVNDEEHMSDLLKALWAAYGRERVEQPERDIVVIASDTSPADIVVTDLEAEFWQDLMDALIRISPEGFRNRKNEITERSFFFIASEEILTPELINMVKEKIRGMADGA